MPKPKWTRVRDKRTGHHITVAHVNAEHHEVLKDHRATDLNGRPLPPKYNQSVGYDDQQVKALKAEVERRNDGRDEVDLIVVGGTGNKADLVAALEADDQAHSEEN